MHLMLEELGKSKLQMGVLKREEGVRKGVGRREFNFTGSESRESLQKGQRP